MDTAKIVRKDDATVHRFPWGELCWFAGSGLGNSAEMTVGECHIKPGQENPVHRHPNCEEVLHLLVGTIEHTADEERYVLVPGDTITIPPHVRHNARNVGVETAIMSIAFSSADRQMQND